MSECVNDEIGAQGIAGDDVITRGTEHTANSGGPVISKLGNTWQFLYTTLQGVTMT